MLNHAIVLSHKVFCTRLHLVLLFPFSVDFFFQFFLACLMVERRQLVGKGFLTSLLSVKMLLIIFGSLVSINDSVFIVEDEVQEGHE